MTTISAAGVEVDLEVGDIIRSARLAARAEPMDRVRALDRAIAAIDLRVQRIDGALAVAARTGQRRVWCHPRGHWLVDRLIAVRAGVMAARAELVTQRSWWRKQAANA